MNLVKNKWTNKEYKEFLHYLNSLSEDSYKDFNKNLIPDTPNIIGIRVPVLKEIAKEISKGNWREFLSIKKGSIHEEVLIEGLVITNVKLEYKEFIKHITIFADKVYNWAICDYTFMNLKQVKKYRKELWNEIDKFLKSKNPWHQRIGIIILLDYYLEDEYIDKVLEKIDKINSDFYYVQMASAWTIATAFAKYREKTLKYMQTAKINDDIMNMTIKKIRESNRVKKQDKELVLKYHR